MLRRFLVLLPALALPALAAPPAISPAERAANLRRAWAEEHADLGVFAAGKQLLAEAETHFLLAIRLDPECRTARMRLGHRRGADGKWAPGPPREWRTAEAAGKAAATDYGRREDEVFRGEAAAYEALGLELAEPNGELSRRLLLRAFLLDFRRERAARALGLTTVAEGFGRAEEAEALAKPATATEGGAAFLGSLLGVPTVLRACGSAVAETREDPGAAERLARAVHRAQLFTAIRLGLPPRGPGWVTACVPGNRAEFESFVDKTGAFSGPYLAGVKAVGTARSLTPRHFVATSFDPTDGFRTAEEIFTHLAAEDLLWEEDPPHVPDWLLEAAGIDACLTLLGKPGSPCVVLEESSGLSAKDALGDPAAWGRRVLTGSLRQKGARLPGLMRAELQALDTEDLLFAYVLYRCLEISRRNALLAFLHSDAEEHEAAFAAAFGKQTGEQEEEFLSLLAGE